MTWHVSMQGCNLAHILGLYKMTGRSGLAFTLSATGSIADVVLWAIARLQMRMYASATFQRYDHAYLMGHASCVTVCVTDMSILVDMCVCIYACICVCNPSVLCHRAPNAVIECSIRLWLSTVTCHYIAPTCHAQSWHRYILLYCHPHVRCWEDI